MTLGRTPHASPQHLLALDPAVFAGDGTALPRIIDRIASARSDLVLVILGGAGADGLPGADYIIEDGGDRIVRTTTGDGVEDWPPDSDAPTGIGAAIRHLAGALLISPSETIVITGPEVAIDDVAAHVVLVGAPSEVPGAVTVPAGDDGALLTALEDIGLFGSAASKTRDICMDAYERALDSLRRNVTEMGFTAASLKDNTLQVHDSNYASVWARDGIKTGLWTLCLDDEEMTSTFRRTLETLARHQSPSGQIPAYVRLADDRPDYSGIGGIASIDSVLWFVIGAVRYAFSTGDRGFAEEMRPAVEKAMDWLTAHDSNNDALIEIPESSDWMDLFPRSYNVLYDEVLWYQSCRDTGALLDALDGSGHGWTEHAARIKDRIIELFWPSGEQLVELAGSSSGRFSAGEGQYLLSQVTPFDYSWRCDVYANLLAGLTGVLDEAKSERLFRFLWGVGVNTPYPVKCLYPPIASGAEDWKDYFIVNFLNLPGHYHNGGIWPFIGGLWVRFLVDIGRTELAHRELVALAESCRLGIDDEWQFNEWMHAETGRPMGKVHQAWSAASYVRAHLTLHDGVEAPDFSELDPARLSG